LKKKILFSINQVFKRQRQGILITGLFFLLPAVAATILFKYYPMVKTLWMSFFEYKTIFNPGAFVGLKNYIDMFQVSLFLKSWGNTLILGIFFILLGFWVPILQALLLSYIRKFQGFIRVLYLLPMVVPGVVAAYLWKWMFNPGNGLFNTLLIKFGGKPLLWLNDPDLVKFSLALPVLLGGGIAVLIYLAAIEGVPAQLYEAGDLDGMNAWMKIRYITLPSIKSIIKIQFILMVITVFQIFDAPFIMTGGGPVNESKTVSMLVYDYGFQRLQYGKSSTAAMGIFVVLVLMTIVQIATQKEENE
jgi:multiple sugar transport system permease protein